MVELLLSSIYTMTKALSSYTALPVEGVDKSWGGDTARMADASDQRGVPCLMMLCPVHKWGGEVGGWEWGWEGGQKVGGSYLGSTMAQGLAAHPSAIVLCMIRFA